MSRLTYKSSMGDYGSAKEYDTPQEEIQALRNALGKYEDLNFLAKDVIRDYRFLAHYCIDAKLFDAEDGERLLNPTWLTLLERMLYI